MSHPHEKTTKHSCPACSYGPFTRNNYFTGKLMVERDFTDETRYHMEKVRHHQQQLHGWGVVCGLKVTPHLTPACRDRFVCIEPGYAVDCCGHDILVKERECVDITKLPAIAELRARGDQAAHRLQICVRFRECPTEEIPVLYDDCGCDDTKCAPNRILESYDVDVMVDPPDASDTFKSPKLKWGNSIALAHAARVALHDASHRLYVATADSPSTVFQASTDTHATITSRTLPAKAIAITVANDGNHLYVVTEPVAPATLRQLHVLNTSKPGMPDVNTNPIDLPASGGSDVKLAVAPDNRLLAYVATSGDVLRWKTDIDTNANPDAPVVVKKLAANLAGFMLSSDGKRAFALGPGKKIQVLDIAAATATDFDVLPTGANPTSMALISSSGPDMLAVADQAALMLYLIALDPTPVKRGSVKMDHKPIALVASPGGHWVYVLEQDAAKSFVQSVSVDRLQQMLPVTPSLKFTVGNDSRQLVISKSGARLYIPYTDDMTNPALGGVAILEVAEGSCAEILWRHLEGCPHCDMPNCVVLATIENYNLGDRIEAQTDPPADPAQDATDKIARIDNRQGRRLLPSTQVLTELIECLLDHGTGGAGTQGPVGPRGPEGPKGDSVTGERGPQGEPGPGLELGLTRIEALSWTHNSDKHLPVAPPDPNSFFVMVERPNGQQTPGIVIGFTSEVQSKTIDASHVFQVLVESAGRDDPNAARGIVCRCPIRGETVPVKLKLDAQGRILLNGAGRIDFAAEIPPGDARGVAFLLEGTRIAREILNGSLEGPNPESPPEIWIKLRGDFVLEKQKPELPPRAIDAEFVRSELPTGDRPRPPAAQPLAQQLGIQGGLFESWLQIRRRG